MFRLFGTIGHNYEPKMNMAVPPEPLKSSVTGSSLFVNCYLDIKFHKNIRVNKEIDFNCILISAC